MKQLLILSGKGGTGKTTVAGAFIRLSQARAYADCDVDAPNLHLLVSQCAEPEREIYFGMPRAEIDEEKCVSCALCKEHCRFDAITTGAGGCRVDPMACEGCGVCEAICPAGAVSMVPAEAGELTLYREDGRVFSTARLKMGSGTSGKLVSEVKSRLKAAAAPGAELAVIDGSPGIGCPVISSLSGVDMVLIVAEPSLSGISDMERVIKTAETFQVRIGVCINKYNISPEKTEHIENFCRERALPLTGKIPFDREAIRAVNRGLTLADVDCAAGRAVREVYDQTMRLLFEGDGCPE
jgi:MinD superfamily P-loop ATPase